jgi:hypothetical protein
MYRETLAIFSNGSTVATCFIDLDGGDVHLDRPA